MAHYSFKTNISAEEYLRFLVEVSAYSFTQLPAWAKVKDNWKSIICGVYADDRLAAASLLLTYQMPLGQKLIYAPRGFVLDYADQSLLSVFTDGIRDYAKSIGAFSVKIDPFVINETYENKGDVPSFGNSFDVTLSALGEQGYVHQGDGKALGDYFQPRFNMAIPLFEGGQPIEPKVLLKTFSKGARSYIGNFHKNRGVFFEAAPADDDLSEFIRLLSHTERRQGIQLRNAGYFQKIRQSFGDRAVVYYASVDLDVYIAYIQSCIDKGQNIESNTRSLTQAASVRKERGQVVKLAAALVLLPQEDAKLKIAEYLYAGADTSILSNLSAPVGLVYQGICDCLAQGCHYFNLGGVDGDFASPLAIFKQKFSPHIFEFVGEFDLIIGRIRYFGFNRLLPAIRIFAKRTRSAKKSPPVS